MLASRLISLVAVVIAIVIAWLTARRVSCPLIALAGEMAKAGRLELDELQGRPSLFREIDMMNTALVQMKHGLRSFARYVPRDLVRTLVASGLDAELTGEVRTLTVFFSDLVGFTALAESRTPEELARISTRAVDAYVARRFDEAAAAWGEILAYRSEDGAAIAMRDRALAFLATPPPPDWAGVTVATQK